uniref:GntR family transcriptional regulator n=1 Tax=Anaerolinea thermolimosa TaxID=229919 RepID=A0A7C4KGR3_9CHLR
MPKEQVTAEAVSQAIMQRIITGQYLPGDTLPSVREMAQQLHSNRNTVNKAYQMLQELGVIEMKTSGRKGFVVRPIVQLESRQRSDLLEYFYRQSVELVWQGMAAGLSSEEMLDQLTAAVTEVYGRSEIRLKFFECNRHDCEEMGRNLSKTLGLRVEFDLLDGFFSNVGCETRQNDLIITTFHHLAEVIEAIRGVGEEAKKVVGIDTRPTPEVLLQIARLPGGRIGVVSTMQNTSNMLSHLIYSYHPDRLIEGTTIDSPEQVRRLAQECHHLVVTHTCAAGVKALTGRSPDVVVNFQIDDQSILFLRQRIYEIQRDRATAMQPGLTA